MLEMRIRPIRAARRSISGIPTASSCKSRRRTGANRRSGDWSGATAVCCQDANDFLRAFSALIGVSMIPMTYGVSPPVPFIQLVAGRNFARDVDDHGVPLPALHQLLLAKIAI